MKIDRMWLWLGGALAGGGVALALGVPLGTLLIVAAILACPAMMLLGMRDMHGAGGMAGHSGSQEPARTERNPTASPPEPSRPEEFTRKS